MRIIRTIFVFALAPALAAALASCGHGHGGAHLLPQTKGGGAGGGAAGNHRHVRTINEAAYPNAVLSDHPAAFYRLDDTGSTMSDAGGNGLNGSYGSSVVRNASGLVPNTIDPAATFPGGSWSANAIATVPQNSTLQPSAVSVEAWVDENVANSTGTIDLVSYGSQTGGQGYTLQISPSNTIEWFMTTSGGAGNVDLVGTTVLSPGASYHVVATYDGSNAKIYVNGVLDASSTGGSAITYAGIGTYGLSIGAGQSTSRKIFNGTIDDVSVFGSALSATQAAAHYAAAQSQPDDPYAQAVMAAGPSAYYRLDDAGATMYDATNDRVNGTYGSSITKRVTGLVANTTDTAAGFPGGTVSSTNIATVPQNSSYLQPSSTISVEAWIKETTANSGQNVDLVSYGPQTGRAYALEITAANQLKWLVTTSGTSIALVGSTTLSTGTVYHVVATYDGSNAKLYVNGSQDVSVTGSGSISYSGIGTYGLSIGGGQSTTRNVINGTVDEVAIYGTALSAAQVSAHYNTTTFTASQAGPAHLLTAAYYEPGKDGGVALTYMLRHVDYVVVDFGDYSLANSFRAAGGSHAMWYTDPMEIYHCQSPFGPTGANTPGACGSATDGWPLGDSTLNTDETAWLHAATSVSSSSPTCYAASSGARLHKWAAGDCSSSGPFAYAEVLKAGSSHAQSAYSSYTSGVTSSNPLLDTTWMDDSGPYYNALSGTGGLAWEFGAASSEYGTSNGNTTYTSDLVAMACKASKPVFFNGPNWNPLDSSSSAATKTADTTMLSSPCVRGGEIEGTFVTSSGRKNLNQQAQWYTFIPSADRALEVQSLQKIALIDDYASCAYGSSGCTFDPTGDRLYHLGGVWLVYDPRFTMVWNQIDPENGDPNMIDTDGNFDGLVQEYNIVPTQPYQTATSNDITTLQIADGHSAGSGSPAGGVFRREFAQCYQNGSSIGRCAVVLNPESSDYTSGGVVSMPTFSHGPYSSVLVLNDVPADAGGTATWSTTIPTSLQPMTAVILKQ
jgi:hypothetical protein